MKVTIEIVTEGDMGEARAMLSHARRLMRKPVPKDGVTSYSREEQFCAGAIAIRVTVDESYEVNP